MTPDPVTPDSVTGASLTRGAHAVVTGAGSGIGRAIALDLAGAGMAVTAIGRRIAPLEKTAAAHGGIHPVVADVTDSAALHARVRQAADRRGPPVVVVANAGAAESAPFARAEPALFQRMLSVNLLGVVHTFQAGLAAMNAGTDGRLVAIASTAALKGYPYVSAYCAAKHGVLGLVRALALELAPGRITVNAVCPGYCETPLLDSALTTIAARTGDRAAAADALRAANPQGRFVQPVEVARTVRWLCGPHSGAVNGQAIALSGGEI